MNSHWLAKILANQRACKIWFFQKLTITARLTLVGTKNGGRLEEWRRQHVGIWLISLSSSYLHTASKHNLKVNITHYMQDSQRSG